MSQVNPSSIDPNTADIETLDQLPGVGPDMARRIFEARPYVDLEDLRRVSGIGPAVLERLRPFLSLSNPPGSAAVGGEAASLSGEASGEFQVPDAEDSIEFGMAPGPEEPAPGPTGDAETLLARVAAEPEIESPFAEPVLIEAETEPEPELVEAEAELKPELAEVEVEPELELAEVEVEPEPELAEAEAELEPEALVSAVEEAEFVVEEGEAVLVAEVEGAPEEGEEAPQPEAEPVVVQKLFPTPTTRKFVFGIVVVGSLLALFLSLVVSLGLLAALNGGQLQFVQPAQFSKLAVRVEGLESRADVLEADMDGLRTRLDSLEAMTGRVQALESEVERLQTELEGLAEQVDGVETRMNGLAEQTKELEAQAGALAKRADELEARTEAMEGQVGRFEAFLGGLRDLLDTLFQAEEDVK